MILNYIKLGRTATTTKPFPAPKPQNKQTKTNQDRDDGVRSRWDNKSLMWLPGRERQLSSAVCSSVWPLRSAVLWLWIWIFLITVAMCMCKVFGVYCSLLLKTQSKKFTICIIWNSYCDNFHFMDEVRNSMNIRAGDVVQLVESFSLMCIKP